MTNPLAKKKLKTQRNKKTTLSNGIIQISSLCVPREGSLLVESSAPLQYAHRYFIYTVPQRLLCTGFSLCNSAQVFRPPLRESENRRTSRRKRVHSFHCIKNVMLNVACTERSWVYKQYRNWIDCGLCVLFTILDQSRRREKSILNAPKAIDDVSP